MRAALLLVPFAIPFAVEVALMSEPETSSGLAVSPETIDLGERSFGDRVRIHARIMNASSHPMRLDPPRSDCGCLATSLSTSLLSPGQSAHVNSLVQAAPIGPLRRAIDLVGWGGADGLEQHRARVEIAIEVVRGMALEPRVSHTSMLDASAAVFELACGYPGIGSGDEGPEVVLDGDLTGSVEFGRELAPELKQLTARVQVRDPSAFGLLSSELRVEDPLGRVPVATARLLANRAHPGVTPWPACWLVVPHGHTISEILEFPRTIEVVSAEVVESAPSGYHATVVASASGTRIQLVTQPGPRPEATVWIRARIAGGRGTIQVKVNDLGG